MSVIAHANPEPAVRERMPVELPWFSYTPCVSAGAGWAHYMERLRVGRDALEASVEAVQATDQDVKRLRATLEGLGSVFVKFGQLPSLWRDMLPRAYIEELQRLQDDAAVFPDEQAREIVERELGKSVHALFTSFDEMSLAAASIGQVHTVQLIDGTSAVVKTQRPGIEPIIHVDVRVVRFLVR